MDQDNTPPNNPPLITPNADPALATTVESIERELLTEIMQAIQHNEMTPDDAQKLAQEFLRLLPVQDKQDLLAKLRNLGDKNKQAKFVYNSYAAELEEQKRQQTLDIMHQHLQNGNIDQALLVAKEAYAKPNS